MHNKNFSTAQKVAFTFYSVGKRAALDEKRLFECAFFAARCLARALLYADLALTLTAHGVVRACLTQSLLHAYIVSGLYLSFFLLAG